MNQELHSERERKKTTYLCERNALVAGVMASLSSSPSPFFPDLFCYPNTTQKEGPHSVKPYQERYPVATVIAMPLGDCYAGQHTSACGFTSPWCWLLCLALHAYCFDGEHVPVGDVPFHPKRAKGWRRTRSRSSRIETLRDAVVVRVEETHRESP